MDGKTTYPDINLEDTTPYTTKIISATIILDQISKRRTKPTTITWPTSTHIDRNAVHGGGHDPLCTPAIRYRAHHGIDMPYQYIVYARAIHWTVYEYEGRVENLVFDLSYTSKMTSNRLTAWLFIYRYMSPVIVWLPPTDFARLASTTVTEYRNT